MPAGLRGPRRPGGREQGENRGGTGGHRVPLPQQLGSGTSLPSGSNWDLLAGPCKLWEDLPGLENNKRRWNSGALGPPPALGSSGLFAYGLVQSVFQCENGTHRKAKGTNCAEVQLPKALKTCALQCLLVNMLAAGLVVPAL